MSVPCLFLLCPEHLSGLSGLALAPVLVPAGREAQESSASVALASGSASAGSPFAVEALRQVDLEPFAVL